MTDPFKVMERKLEMNVPAALILFNTRFAETPDDEAIERLATETCKFILHRAEKRKLAMGDVICAMQESLSRLLVAPFVAKSLPRDGTEKLIVEMMSIGAKRAIGLLDAQMPGDGDQEQ